MPSVSFARRPHAVRATEERVNLFLLPSISRSDTADRSKPESGM